MGGDEGGEQAGYLGRGDGGPPVAQVLAPPVGPGDVLLELAVLLLHGADFLLQFAHNLPTVEWQSAGFEPRRATLRHRFHKPGGVAILS